MSAVQEKLQLFIEQAKQQPAKVVVLVALTGLMLVLWLRMMPGRSRANTSIEVAPVTVDVDGQELAVPKIGRSAQLVADWRKVPVPNLGRNFFAFADMAMPVETTGSTLSVSAGLQELDGHYWQQLEQALADATDRRRRRESTRQEILADSHRYFVTGLVTGKTAMAYVSGQLVGVGDLVPEGPASPTTFRVVHIDAVGIVLSRDDVLVRLHINGDRNSLISVPQPRSGHWGNGISR
ncbi:MAG: hypothetical protein AAGK78_10395 [Planctomycetota bacterium]